MVPITVPVPWYVRLFFLSGGNMRLYKPVRIDTLWEIKRDRATKEPTPAHLAFYIIP